MTTILKAGDKAPDFDLPSDGGGTAKLADFAGRKLVLYFYPKDDTSGCTREAIDFTQKLKAFADADTSVIGVSADSVEKHDKFKKKHDLAVTLVSDGEHDLLKPYGVWVEKSMYGRKYMGIERATYLIGRDGAIVNAWRKVKVPGHAEEVLAAARAAG